MPCATIKGKCARRSREAFYKNVEMKNLCWAVRARKSLVLPAADTIPQKPLAAKR